MSDSQTAAADATDLESLRRTVIEVVRVYDTLDDLSGIKEAGTIEDLMDALFNHAMHYGMNQISGDPMYM